ncbi:hypothetical protein MKS88_001064 [Plasmodium brasilianum]|uniref:Uncharacterized protein n=1 Tax=Plasmodium brasilianum TaxID=5824 RepID=A0ACB9YDA6_PLABR|nr:hypothetical protein MKS88_001064 [Plasmodium brasilianum]
MNRKNKGFTNLARYMSFKMLFYCLPILSLLEINTILTEENVCLGLQMKSANFGRNLTEAHSEDSLKINEKNDHQSEQIADNLRLRNSKNIINRTIKNETKDATKTKRKETEVGHFSNRTSENKGNEEQIKFKAVENENFGNKILESRIKLTEEEVTEILDSLEDVVSKKEMYIVWFNVHNHCIKKYYAMIEELWTNIKLSAFCRNLSEKDLLKIWWKAYPDLITELKENDKNCIIDFYNLFDRGECTRDEYKNFIDNRKKNWTSITNVMKYKWNNLLMDLIKNITSWEYTNDDNPLNSPDPPMFSF